MITARPGEIKNVLKFCDVSLIFHFVIISHCVSCYNEGKHPPSLSLSQLQCLYSQVLLVLASLILAASALVQPRNELTCSICMDIMQDLDDFITSDTTEQQIVDAIEEVNPWSGVGLLVQSLFPSDLQSSGSSHS